MGSVLINKFVKYSIPGSAINSLKCVHYWNSMYSNFVSQYKVICLRLIVRSLSVNDCDDCEQEHYIDFDKYKEEKVSNRKAASLRLQDVFGCPLKEADSMVGTYPALKYVSAKNALYNIQYLKEKGVPEEKLYQNPWLLTYRSGTLSAKLEMLKKMNLDDVNGVLPLLQLPLPKLRQYAALAEKESSYIPHGNRMKYICEKFKCDLVEVCHIFVKHPFLYSVHFDRFSSIVELLLEAEVSPAHILRDMWVFRYSPSSVQYRLEKYKEAGVKTIKPWMLRCSNKAFSNKFRREMSRKELLGENSIVDYLSERLNCDADTIEYISSKYPSILKVHVSKLKEIMDFLYGEGYTSNHIHLVPRILFGSIETIKARFMELKDLGYTPTSLLVLCKSRRQYKQFLYMLKKNNEEINE